MLYTNMSEYYMEDSICMLFVTYEMNIFIFLHQALISLEKTADLETISLSDYVIPVSFMNCSIAI